VPTDCGRSAAAKGVRPHPARGGRTQLILRGATTAQVAQWLAISPHTVNDHLNSVFDKARTRGELSATLFFGGHPPRIQRQTPVGDDASFIETPSPPRSARLEDHADTGPG